MKAKVNTYDPSLAFPFVARHEGLRLEAYKCPAGVWTIGYGHTGGVKKGDTITKEEADALLKEDLRKYAEEAGKLIKVPVSEGQYIALLDFAYNLGVTQFRYSTLLKKLNVGDDAGAASELLKWKYANGKVLPGLLKRRQDEYKLFVIGD